MWWCTLLAIDFRRQRQADLRLVYIGIPASNVLRPSLKKKMKMLRKGREWRAPCRGRREGQGEEEGG